MQETTTKEATFRFCQNNIDTRLSRIREHLDSIRSSLTIETKSSAGDKHETGRAMLQLEREKLGRQLAEAESVKHLLSRVKLDVKSDKIGLGSLVYTSKAIYFLAISAGEFKNTGESIFCISPSTPIGKLLLGKSAGDSIVFNGSKIRVEKIT